MTYMVNFSMGGVVGGGGENSQKLYFFCLFVTLIIIFGLPYWEIDFQTMKGFFWRATFYF